MAYSDQVGSPFYVTTEMMVLFLSVPVPVTMRSSNKLYHPNRRQTASIYSIWLVRCLSSPPAPYLDVSPLHLQRRRRIQ